MPTTTKTLPQTRTLGPDLLADVLGKWRQPAHRLVGLDLPADAAGMLGLWSALREAAAVPPVPTAEAVEASFQWAVAGGLTGGGELSRIVEHITRHLPAAVLALPPAGRPVLLPTEFGGRTERLGLGAITEQYQGTAFGRAAALPTDHALWAVLDPGEPPETPAHGKVVLFGSWADDARRPLWLEFSAVASLTRLAAGQKRTRDEAQRRADEARQRAERDRRESDPTWLRGEVRRLTAEIEAMRAATTV